MTLKLYNTLTRSKQDFTPTDPERVTMYVCGPTVYDFAHIGNARPAVVFDVLFRLLRTEYGVDHVAYAQNITDVDDKINKAHQETGEPIADISARYSKAYWEDMTALNVMQPTIQPYATQHISQMIALIETLIEKGHAYATEDGHVLFSVPSMADYGSLSRLDKDQIIAGARVEIADYKKDPSDFVLWKPSADDLPGWESPWGRGRPGWHIECSAMAATHLGHTIDIHGGGLDLVFPHHENEIAQSTCAHGAPLANYWVHNGYLTVEGEKMSKSVGNITTVRQLRDQGVKGEVIRLMLLTAQYRQPLDWKQKTVEQCKNILDRLYRALEGAASVEPASIDIKSTKFYAALCDDINTPEALAALTDLAGQLNKAPDNKKPALKGELLACGALLGVVQQNPQTWFQGDTSEDAEIESLISARNQARADKDFAEADRLRDELADRGIILEDSAQGTTWKRA